MWINSGDQVKKNGEILTVTEISGLYSVASNVKICLKNEATGEMVEMPYMSEFYPQFNEGKITAVNISKKNQRGY